MRTHITSLQHELPDPYVRRVFVDNSGLMWIGTLSGLFTYDGVSFAKFENELQTFNYVDNVTPFHQYIIVDNTKVFQIINTTNKAVVYQSEKEETLQHIYIGPKKEKVYLLLETVNFKSKLISFDLEGFIRDVTLPNHDQRISTFAIDEKNGIYFVDKAASIYYFGTDKTLVLIDDSSFKHLPIFHYPIISIINQNKVNVITNHEQVLNLYRIVSNELQLIQKDRFPSQYLQSIDGHRLNLYNEDTKRLSIYNLSTERFDEIIQLPKEILRIFNLHEDQVGNIWIPYESVLGSGIFIALNDKSEFTSIQYFQDDGQVKPIRIRDILKDHSGTLLASGLDGFFYRDSIREELKRIPLSQDNSNFINGYGIVKDEESRAIWLGRSDQGIYKLNANNRIIEHLVPETPESQMTTDLFMDKDQVLWIGAWNNITWYDTKAKKFLPTINPSPSFHNVRAYHWVQTDSSDVWLCTSNGLFLFDSKRKIKRWYHQLSDPPLSSDEIFDVAKSNDRYFIATNNGLNILHQDSIAVLGKQHGFASNIIASILVDNEDVWLGTYTGLTQYNLNTGDVQNYYEEDGLPNNEFNRVARYKTPDGLYYFGTQNGIVYFHPDSFRSQRNPANLTLKAFSRYSSDGEVVSVNPQDITGDNEIILPAGNKYFEVKLALLQLINSSQNKYTYYLEGLESDWKELSLLNTIQYNNLPAGRYTLRAKAMDHAGVWSKNELSIPILVLQHYYKSWWFLSLCGLIIFGLFYGYYKMRLAQVVRIERLRTKLSSDLHDDVGSLLSGVAYQMELLEYTVDEKRKPLVQQIAASSRKAMNRMRDVVWAIDSRNNTCADLLDRINDFADELLEPLGIKYQFKIEDKVKQVNVPSEYRHDVLLICKEFLTNTVKHAEANHVKLKVYPTSDKISFHIVDNGKGLSKGQDEQTGQGLKNIKMRAKKMNADLVFHTKNGFGITLSIPALQ